MEHRPCPRCDAPVRLPWPHRQLSASIYWRHGAVAAEGCCGRCHHYLMVWWTVSTEKAAELLAEYRREVEADSTLSACVRTPEKEQQA